MLTKTKAAILKMFQQIRADILEMNRKIESLSKEIKEVKDQMGILELKNTINGGKKKNPG